MPVRVRLLIGTHPRAVQSVADLNKYYRNVSSTENLNRRGISCWGVILGVPLLMFTAGLGLNHLGVRHALLDVPILTVIWFDLLVLLFLLFWGERKLLKTLVAIRPAFDVEDSEYYRFVGRLLQWLYEPSPFADGDGRIRLHLLSGAAYASTFALLLFISTQLPERVFVVSGAFLSIALQVYILVTIGLVSFGLLHGFWATACLVWFMGIRGAELPLRAPHLRSIDNLGLQPYGTFILYTALIGFVGLIATGYVYLITPHPLLMVVTILGTVLFVCWYAGAQIGFHQSMQRAKRDRVQKLTRDYKRCTESWLNSSTSESHADLVAQTRSIIEIKREIERIPTWPGNITGHVQIVSAAIISYLPFYAQFFELFSWAVSA